jgi:hypothetical protein
VSQPTFPDGPPVPLMVDGLIDAATLRQLFEELEQYATILNVREKNSPTSYTEQAEQPLQNAVPRLLSGESRATQIRYRYDDFEWTDTFLAMPKGYKVVRCRH